MTGWILFYLLMLGFAFHMWLTDKEEGPLEARKRARDIAFEENLDRQEQDELPEVGFLDEDGQEPWGARR